MRGRWISLGMLLLAGACLPGQEGAPRIGQPLSVEGRVRVAGSNRGIAGVMLTLGDGRFVTSGDDGGYRLEGQLAAADQVLRVDAFQFDGARVLRTGRAVSAPHGERRVTGFDLALPDPRALAAGIIQGSIEAAHGGPAVGIIVRLHAPDGGLPTHRARSDESGAFLLKGVAPGHHWLVAEDATTGRRGEIPVEVQENVAGPVLASLRLSPTDQSPPRFLGGYPCDRCEDVPADAEIRLRFTEPLDPVSALGGGVRLFRHVADAQGAREEALPLELVEPVSEDGWLRLRASGGLPLGGRYTLRLSALLTDRASAPNPLEGAPIEASFETRDNTPPQIDALAPRRIREGDTLELTVYAGDRDGDEVTLRAAALPRGAQFIAEEALLRWTPAFDQAGEHIAQFEASDGHGVGGGSVRIEVVDVNQAPRWLPNTLPETLEGETLQGRVEASDPDGDALRYFWLTEALAPEDAAMLSGLSFDGESGEILWATPIGAGRAGPLTLQLLAWDGAAGTEASFELPISARNAPPQVSVSAAAAVDEGDTLRLPFEASDPDADPITARVFPEDSGARVEAQHLVLTPDFESAGRLTLVLEVSDGRGGVAQAAVEVMIRDANRPPEFEALPEAALFEGELLQRLIAVRDPDGDAIQIRADLPQGARYFDEGRLLEWRPDFGFVARGQQSREATVSFFAEDARGGRSRATLSLQVHDLNQPPRLVEEQAPVGAEGEALSVGLQLEDPDGDAFDVELLRAPDALELLNEPWRLVWTPGFDAAGLHRIALGLVDARGAASELAFDLEITDVNRPPQLTPPPDQSVVEGQRLTLRLDAVDPDGDPLTFEARGLPEGAELDAISGWLRWSTDYDDAGSYRLEVEVDDGQASALHVFDIEVLAVNRPPVLSLPPGQGPEVTALEGMLFELELEASDPDGDAVVCAWLNEADPKRPAALQLDAESCSLRYLADFEAGGGAPIELALRASDGAEHAQLVFVLVIEDVDRAPTVSVTSGSPLGREGEPMQVALEARDPDGEAATMELLEAPANSRFELEGAAGSRGRLDWTPDFLEAGLHVLRVRAYNAGGETQLQLELRVENHNRPPELTLPDVARLVVGVPFVLDVGVQDADSDDRVELRLEQAPAGASLDAATQRVRFVPGPEQVGTLRLTLSADDGHARVHRGMDLVVAAANSAPRVEIAPELQVLEGELLVAAVLLDDADGDPLEVEIEGLTGARFDAASGELRYAPDFEAAGIHAARITARDPAGAEAAADFRVEVANSNRAPQWQLPPSHTVFEGESSDLPLVAVDPDGDPLHLRLVQGPTWAQLAGETIRFTPGFSDAGIAELQLSADDGIDLALAQLTIEVQPVNRPPEIFLPAGARTEVAEGDTLSLVPLARDPDGDVLSFSASGLPVGASFDAGGPRLLWTPVPGQRGSYDAIRIRVDDGALVAELPLLLRVLARNRAPSLEVPQSLVGREGEVLRFNLLGRDPDGDALEFRAEAMPEGAVLDAASASFRWTPSFEQAGHYDLRFFANDGNLEGSAATAIQIEEVNRAPQLELPAELVAPEGALLEVTLTASDPDGDPLSFRSDNLPEGATLEAGTGVLRWLPDFTAAGSYRDVRIEVSDGALSAQGQVDLVVEDRNRPPRFSDPGPLAVLEGTQLAHVLAGFDPDGDPLRFAIITGPVGLALAPDSGMLSWTPDFTQAGSYQATISIGDGQTTTIASVDLTVVDVNRPPVLTDPGPQRLQADVVFELRFQASDPDGDPLQLRASGLPPGATFDPDAALLRWTPNAAQRGVYTATRLFASDGEAESLLALRLLVDEQCPTLEPVAEQSLVEGEGFELLLSAQDADGDPLSFAVDAGPVGLEVDPDTGRLRWLTDFEDAGRYPVTVSVSDGLCAVATEFELVVQALNRAPVFAPLVAPALREGERLSLEIRVEDPDGDPVVLEAFSLPAGASFDAPTLNWPTDFDDAGRYVLRFSASDGQVSSGMELALEVENFNRAPRLSAPSFSEVRAEALLVMAVDASDADGDPVTLSVEGLPDGARFDPGSGVFEWIPGAAQVGRHDMRFTANDGQLGSSALTTVLVSSPDQPPVIDAPSKAVVREGETLALALQIRDPEDALRSVSVTGLPPGGEIGADLMRWPFSATDAGVWRATLSADDGQHAVEAPLVVVVLDADAFAGQLAQVRLEGGGVLGLDAGAGTLWRFDAEGPGIQAQLGDLDGDGAQEAVLFLGAEGAGTAYALDGDGVPMLHLVLGSVDGGAYGRDTRFAPEAAVFVDTDGDGASEVLSASNHADGGAAFIAHFDIEGVVRGSWWNPGAIAGLLKVDLRGDIPGPELVAFGDNAAMGIGGAGLPFVALLDSAAIAGAAPPGVNGRSSTEALWYRVLGEGAPGRAQSVRVEGAQLRVEGVLDGEPALWCLDESGSDVACGGGL